MVSIIRKLRQIEVLRNFSYLTVGGILSQAIGLVTLIKLARVFSPEHYGLYTFLLVQGQLIITIGDLGVRNIIVRSIARDRERTNELIRTAAFLKVSAVIILAVFYIGYNAIWGHLSINEILLISIFSILNCLADLSEAIFMGNQKMLPISVINISSNAIWCLIVFLLPDHRIGVVLVFTIFIFITLLRSSALFLFLKFNKFLVGTTRKFLPSAKQLLKESWPFLSLTLVMLPINYFSNNFLDINSTQEQLGYFNLSQKLMMPITLTMGFALSAIFPNFSSLWAKDKEKFYHYISVGMKYFIFMSLTLCFLFTIFAREIVTLLFTDEYLPAIKVCQLQIWFVFLMSINSLIGTIWAATNMEKLIFKTGIINAFISTPMLFFGSRYGALGLSYGYVVSFAIFEFYLWHKFKSSENIKIKGDLFVWSSVVILFVVSYFIPQETSILYRISITLVFGCIFGYYLLKTHKLHSLKHVISAISNDSPLHQNLK